jgi:hypothetical protein
MLSKGNFGRRYSKRLYVPPRDWLVRVDDMLDAALAASDFITGMTFEQFREDRKTIDAVVRNLEVTLVDQLQRIRRGRSTPSGPS